MCQILWAPSARPRSSMRTGSRFGRVADRKPRSEIAGSIGSIRQPASESNLEILRDRVRVALRRTGLFAKELAEEKTPLRAGNLERHPRRRSGNYRRICDCDRGRREEFEKRVHRLAAKIRWRTTFRDKIRESVRSWGYLSTSDGVSHARRASLLVSLSRSRVKRKRETERETERRRNERSIGRPGERRDRNEEREKEEKQGKRTDEREGKENEPTGTSLDGEGGHARGSRIDMQQAAYAGHGSRTIRPPVRHHRVNYSPFSSL